MHSSSFFAAVVLPLVVSAAPAPAPEPQLGGILNPLVCVVNGLLTGLLNDPLAVPYCQSVLGLPTATVGAAITLAPSVNVSITLTGSASTVTSTSTTVATATTTQTVSGFGAAAVSSSTGGATTLSCLTAAYTASKANAKRDEKRQITTGISVGLGLAVPTLLSGLPLPSVTSACSCLSVPKPSVTVTATVLLGPTVTRTATINVLAGTPVTTTVVTTQTSTLTSTVTSGASSSVGAAGSGGSGGGAIGAAAVGSGTTITTNGLSWKKFTHPYDADQGLNSGFTSSFFKGKTADFTGTAQSLSYASQYWPGGPGPLTIGDHTFDSNSSAALFQGFFVSKQAGVHTFQTGPDTVDNWGYLWVGTNAYSGWTDQNANLISTRLKGQPIVPGSYSVTMGAGDAIPFTWLWANGGGPGLGDLRVKQPDGSVVTTDGYLAAACSSGNPFT